MIATLLLLRLKPSTKVNLSKVEHSPHNYSVRGRKIKCKIRSEDFPAVSRCNLLDKKNAFQLLITYLNSNDWLRLRAPCLNFYFSWFTHERPVINLPGPWFPGDADKFAKNIISMTLPNNVFQAFRGSWILRSLAKLPLWELKVRTKVLRKQNTRKTF